MRPSRHTSKKAVVAFFLVFCCAVLSANAAVPRIGRPITLTPRLLSPAAPLQSTDTRVGTNVATIAPGASTAVVFVDAMKQASAWVSNGPLKTDDGGTVRMLLPGQIAETAIAGNYPAGTYTLLYDGTGTLIVPGAPTFRTGPGRMLVRIAPLPGRGIHLLLTGVDPNDYVRNIRLIMPGFENSYVNHPFYPPFVRAMQRFHVLRFKNWSRTDTFVESATWTERPTVTGFSQAGPAGVAGEYQVALANATGDDPWFSIPMGATDYYIANLAQLVRTTLDPRLHPIFEYGYEAWQPGSPDNLYAQMAGTNFRLDANRQSAALDWYSLRSLQAFSIINRVYGPDRQRVTRVLSGPPGLPGSLPAAIDNAILSYANAGQSADAFAVAARGFSTNTFSRQANPFALMLRGASELARSRHLALVAYDGPEQPLPPQFVNRSYGLNAPLNRYTYSTALESWHAAGGGLFVTAPLNPDDAQKLGGIADYMLRHPAAHTIPLANQSFVPPPTPQLEVRHRRAAFNPATYGTSRLPAAQKVLPLSTRSRRVAAVSGTTYTPGTTAATQTPFYKFPGESGAISQQMDPSPSGSLTNETLTYTAHDGNNWGWVSGPNEPGITSWPATNYVVTLNITQPNANLQLNEVRIFRVNSSGGPGYDGLAVVADMPGLTLSLGSAGALTFTLAGSAQIASITDRLVVKFNVTNLAASTQSFSYDAGVGALSGVTFGSSGSPPPGSLTVSPTSLTFTSLSTTSPFTASESNYSGVINQNSASSCTGIAAVSPSSGTGPSTTFTVTPQAQGSCTITVTDDHGGSVPLPVTVSLSGPSPSPSPSGSPPAGTVATVLRWDSSFYYMINAACAHFHVAYNSNTVFLPSRSAIVANSTVDILGSGDCQHNNIVATQISLVGSSSPSPSPSPSASPSPSPSASPSPSPSVSGIPDITVFHIDNQRTGWNPLETKLTTANVKSSLHKISTLSVDGNVLAQPLFVAQYQVPGQGTHNLVIIATEHNSVYAFDADTLAQIWHVNLGTAQNSADVGCADVNPEYGISSTPVINRTGAGSGTIYVVAATEPASMNFHTQLHALNIGTGGDTSVEINASALLTNGSRIQLDKQNQYNRTSLFMDNGSIYVGFSSHCDNHPTPISGWLLRYNQSLVQTNSFNTIDEASGNLASIWMSGYPSAVDASGNIFFATGNGAFDINTGGKNYGETVVKIKPDLSQVLSYFTPGNWGFLNGGDYDLGAGGVMLIPGSNDLVAKGKNPTVFLLNQTNLGGEDNHDAGALQKVNDLADTHGGPAYFKGPGGSQYVYYQADSHPLRAFAFNGSKLTLSSTAPGITGPGGSSPVVSSNGSQAGTGIVWVAQHGDNVTLQAYDATNVQTLLFTGAAGVWSTGNQNDFISPLVVNGRVFVGATNTVTVFGLH